MALVQTTCDNCGHVNVGRWHPDTRTDPGYYEGPEECGDCGHEFEAADFEPYDPHEDEGDAMYDQAVDEGRI